MAIKDIGDALDLLTREDYATMIAAIALGCALVGLFIAATWKMLHRHDDDPSEKRRRDLEVAAAARRARREAMRAARAGYVDPKQ